MRWVILILDTLIFCIFGELFKGRKAKFREKQILEYLLLISKSVRDLYEMVGFDSDTLIFCIFWELFQGRKAKFREKQTFSQPTQKVRNAE